jgi:hypothetical protein
LQASIGVGEIFVLFLKNCFLLVQPFFISSWLICPQPKHHGERKARIFTSVVDPEFGAFLTPGSGMGKKSGSKFGMNRNNPDHISERL